MRGGEEVSRSRMGRLFCSLHLKSVQKIFGNLLLGLSRSKEKICSSDAL